MEALAGEYIRNVFACEKISPHKPRVQASSSSIPRIRIRSIMASINISVTNEQVFLFVSCERRTCELRAGERREPGARENLSLSRLRRPPETSKNVGSLLTGENISLEITKWCFFYLCSFIDTDNWKPENMQERRLPAIFLPEQALLPLSRLRGWRSERL